MDDIPLPIKTYKKKRVAICLSGYMIRENYNEEQFDKLFNYIKKNIIDLYNTDIFVHTWNTDKIDNDFFKKYNITKYKLENYIPEKFN
jgi:hypothetical protein